MHCKSHDFQMKAEKCKNFKCQIPQTAQIVFFQECQCCGRKVTLKFHKNICLSFLRNWYLNFVEQQKKQYFYFDSVKRFSMDSFVISIYQVQGRCYLKYYCNTTCMCIVYTTHIFSSMVVIETYTSWLAVFVFLSFQFL